MKIRTGIYTNYKGIEMKVAQHYGHGITDPNIENYRILLYSESLGLIEGFELDADTNQYFKDVHINDLKNAYYIKTKALYKGRQIEVYRFFEEENLLGVTTYEAIEDSNFVQSLDDFGKEYYKGAIKIMETDEIWEERSQSNLDLPMPKSIEAKKNIEPPS